MRFVFALGLIFFFSKLVILPCVSVWTFAAVYFASFLREMVSAFFSALFWLKFVRGGVHHLTIMYPPFSLSATVQLFLSAISTTESRFSRKVGTCVRVDV